jgi:predicted RNA-binding protein with RPS1 domain
MAEKSLEEGDIVTGIVTRISNERPFGFWVKIDRRKREGFVHISQITGNMVRNISDHVTEGQHVAVKYLGVDYGEDQLSMIGVKQPHE